MEREREPSRHHGRSETHVRTANRYLFKQFASKNQTSKYNQSIKNKTANLKKRSLQNPQHIPRFKPPHPLDPSRDHRSNNEAQNNSRRHAGDVRRSTGIHQGRRCRGGRGERQHRARARAVRTAGAGRVGSQVVAGTNGDAGAGARDRTATVGTACAAVRAVSVRAVSVRH